MSFYILIFVISVLISANSQVLLKISANRIYSKRIQEYLNVYVVSAYSMFLISLILTTFAYKKIPLSFGPILESIGIIFIAFFSWMVLKEKMTYRKLFGYSLIIAGVLISITL